MDVFRNFGALLLAATSLVVSGFLMLSRTDTSHIPDGSSGAIGSEVSDEKVAELRNQVKELTAAVGSLKRSVGISDSGSPQFSTPGENSNSESPDNSMQFVSIDERLRSLESSLAQLSSNYDGISIEGASAERQAIFESADGAKKADEYFEAGKFAIAAEGYMTYYRNHPDDPDSRAVMERARRSYTKAGYSDMAMWLQEKMLDLYPESRAKDLETLASMKKEAGNYGEAVAFSAEAAELTNDPQAKLWTRMYWAWYNELDAGAAAGLDAYHQVQREIQDAGFSNHKLNEQVQEKILEIEKRIAQAR